MAIAVVFEPQCDAAQYDEVIRRLSAIDLAAPDGRLYHVAGPTHTGWRVLDVWESADKFRAFGERLMPVLREVGIPPFEPQVYPVHNLVPGG